MIGQLAQLVGQGDEPHDQNPEHENRDPEGRHASVDSTLNSPVSPNAYRQLNRVHAALNDAKTMSPLRGCALLSSIPGAYAPG